MNRMNASTPLVSVLCITYQHEAFLAQAIESVLMQQTNFAVELVIGEDASPDGTRAIAMDYARRYPGRVRVLAHPRNLGSIGNLLATLVACRGEFVALLGGDDYWTDPTKLQRQVRGLQQRPQCSMCFHDAEIFYDDNSQPVITFAQKFPAILGGIDEEREFTHADMARLNWFIPAASMLLRAASLPRPLPSWFAGVFSEDYTLTLLSTRSGPALYVPRVMSRYRLHAGGLLQITNNTLAQNAKRIFENEHYCRAFAPELRPYFEMYLEHLYFERSVKMGAAGKRRQQLYYYWKAISITRQRLQYHLRRLGGRLWGRGEAT